MRLEYPPRGSQDAADSAGSYSRSANNAKEGAIPHPVAAVARPGRSDRQARRAGSRCSHGTRRNALL